MLQEPESLLRQPGFKLWLGCFLQIVSSTLLSEPIKMKNKNLDATDKLLTHQNSLALLSVESLAALL